jgi:phage tail-like protein
MTGSASITFAADRSVSYPSEVIRFFLHPLDAWETSGAAVEVFLPEKFTLESAVLVDNASAAPSGEATIGVRENHGISGIDSGRIIRWEPSAAGDLLLTTRLDRTAPEGYQVCQALVREADGSTHSVIDLRIQVKRIAEIMQYLPELYHNDDFTNRFLMLFESFWKPISGQLDNISSYFDPYLTPPEFLPWLGSWFGLAMEEDLPTERKRELLANVVPIFDCTGTRQALTTLLRIYSGCEVKIVEHIDKNFVLSAATHLGYQIALGKDNLPHSFDVTLTLSPDLQAMKKESPVQFQQFRRRIENVIDTYKPAHTAYRLYLVEPVLENAASTPETGQPLPA